MTIHTRPSRAARPKQAALRLTLPIHPGATARRVLEDQVSFLINLLDRLDPDVDLEDTGDSEPSLGVYLGIHVDAELDLADDEPSLGSFDRMMNQANWSKRTAATYHDHDNELDRSDFEDNGDTEPNGDEPDDGNDTGIGDAEGLQEQVGCFDEGVNADWWPKRRPDEALAAEAKAARDTVKRLDVILKNLRKPARPAAAPGFGNLREVAL